jgi:hypothetical protein
MDPVEQRRRYLEVMRANEADRRRLSNATQNLQGRARPVARSSAQPNRPHWRLA